MQTSKIIQEINIMLMRVGKYFNVVFDKFFKSIAGEIRYCFGNSQSILCGNLELGNEEYVNNLLINFHPKPSKYLKNANYKKDR
jgi:hypothetical protein